MQIKKIKGVNVGFMSYTFGLNGIPLPEGKYYLVNLIDEEQIKKDMEELTKESDVQIVSMHWEKNINLLRMKSKRILAQVLSDAGVDVIVGDIPM